MGRHHETHLLMDDELWSLKASLETQGHWKRKVIWLQRHQFVPDCKGSSCLNQGRSLLTVCLGVCSTSASRVAAAVFFFSAIFCISWNWVLRRRILFSTYPTIAYSNENQENETQSNCSHLKLLAAWGKQTAVAIQPPYRSLSMGVAITWLCDCSSRCIKSS